MHCVNTSENHKIKFVVTGKAKETWLFKETVANGILFIITAREGHKWIKTLLKISFTDLASSEPFLGEKKTL
jgi:hypothetical protein